MENRMFYFKEIYPENPSKPEKLRFSIVQKADKSFPFLHDTMIYFYQNRLFMAWYNSSSGEIKDRTSVRGRYSDDDGSNSNSTLQNSLEIEGVSPPKLCSKCLKFGHSSRKIKSSQNLTGRIVEELKFTII